MQPVCGRRQADTHVALGNRAGMGQNDVAGGSAGTAIDEHIATCGGTHGCRAAQGQVTTRLAGSTGGPRADFQIGSRPSHRGAKWNDGVVPAGIAQRDGTIGVDAQVFARDAACRSGQHGRKAAGPGRRQEQGP